MSIIQSLTAKAKTIDLKPAQLIAINLIIVLLVSSIFIFIVMLNFSSISSKIETLSQQENNLQTIEGKNVKLLNTPVGGFFFASSGIEKSEKGYKFKFMLGNRNFAQYEGLQMKIRWAKKPEKDQKAKFKETDLTINDPIFAGKWKNFEITIPEKDQKEFEIISLVIISAEKISMIRGR